MLWSQNVEKATGINPEASSPLASLYSTRRSFADCWGGMAISNLSYGPCMPHYPPGRKEMYTTGKSVMRQPTFFWSDLIPILQKELVSGKHSQKSMAREVTGTSSGAEGWFFIPGIQYPRFSPGAQGTYRNTAIYVHILKGECWCFSFLFLIFPFLSSITLCPYLHS